MSDEEFESQDDELESDEGAMADDGSDDESGEGKAEAVVSPEDLALTSTAAHRQLRDSLASDVEAFLARGGKIQQIDDNVMADPPKKPQSSYGSRPI